MTHPAPIYPPALKQGDKIGIVTPSGWHDMDKLAPAIEWLSQYFEVVIHEQNYMKHGQFAGTHQQRADALNDYFKDDSIKAIFCTRGGNGTVHLLDLLDYNLIENNPKILIGFSNVTTLLNSIYTQTGLVTFHGPMLVNLSGRIEERWNNHMIDVLMGKTSSVEIGSDIEASGRLFGGNLSDMQTLIGTPYAPNLNNAILMLEDTNEHTSRYDRMLGHMKQAGWLKSLSGIMLGEFLNSLESDNPFGFTIEEIIANNAPDTPVITNVLFGHGKKLCTLPIGAEITLKNGKLSFKSLA